MCPSVWIACVPKSAPSIIASRLAGRPEALSLQVPPFCSCFHVYYWPPSTSLILGIDRKVIETMLKQLEARN